MDLQKLLQQVSADPKLTKQFTTDPAGVLKQLGYDPSTMNVQTLPAKKAPSGNLTDVSACVSVGCIVCGSVG